MVYFVAKAMGAGMLVWVSQGKVCKWHPTLHPSRKLSRNTGIYGSPTVNVNVFPFLLSKGIIYVEKFMLYKWYKFFIWA